MRLAITNEAADFLNMTNWEARYAHKDTPWDKGMAHPAIVKYVTQHPLEGHILVPGCGNGHDVRAIATPTNHPVGLDVAERAILIANTFRRVANETFICGDLFSMPAARYGQYDWVLEHTCFCAIEPNMRNAYADAVHRVLKPHGRILAVFFLEPRVEFGPPYGVSIAELEETFAAFELVEEHRNPSTFPDRDGVELLRVLRKR